MSSPACSRGLRLRLHVHPRHACGHAGARAAGGHAELGQHAGDHRPAQARRHRRAGACGVCDAGAADREVAGLPVRDGDEQPEDACERADAPSAHGAVGGGGPGAADRLRQPVEPAAGAHGISREGVCGAAGARLQPRPHRLSADGGGRGAGGVRRGDWRAAGLCADRRAQVVGDAGGAVVAPGARGRDGAGHHRVDRDRLRHCRRRGAGVARGGAAAAGRVESPGPRHHRRAASRAGTIDAGGGGSRARLRAAGRRGTPDAQLRPHSGRGSRLPALTSHGGAARGEQPTRRQRAAGALVCGVAAGGASCRASKPPG